MMEIFTIFMPAYSSFSSKGANFYDTVLGQQIVA